MILGKQYSCIFSFALARSPGDAYSASHVSTTMPFQRQPDSLKGVVWPSAMKSHVFMTSPALKTV
jgi:hypothetical protein